MSLKEFLRKRIKDNRELFTDEEKIIIDNEMDLIKKIYLMGLVDNMKTK